MPDAGMFLFYAWEKIKGVPEEQIWSVDFYMPFWQGVFDTTNSIPLIFIAGLVAWIFNHKMALVLLASMLIHVLFDLPVHHDDAHRHFFPFSNFRFISPISYWDPEHHGNLVSIIEVFVCALCAGWLWTNHSSSKIRWTVAALVVIYVIFLFYVIVVWA